MPKHSLQNNVRIRLSKQMCLQLRLEDCQWRGRCDVRCQTLFQSWGSADEKYRSSTVADPFELEGVLE